MRFNRRKLMIYCPIRLRLLQDIECCQRPVKASSTLLTTSFAFRDLPPRSTRRSVPVATARLAFHQAE